MPSNKIRPVHKSAPERTVSKKSAECRGAVNTIASIRWHASKRWGTAYTFERTFRVNFGDICLFLFRNTGYFSKYLEGYGSVNAEIFARILFSRIALKDIFGKLNFVNLA